MYGHADGMYSNGMFFGGGLLMWIFWIVLFVILVYVVIDVFGSVSKRSSSGDALEILKERFAKGEIDEAEFERRKNKLQ